MNVTKEFKVKYAEHKQRKNTWSSSSSSLLLHIQWMYTNTRSLPLLRWPLSLVCCLLSQWEHWENSRATAKIVLLIIFMAVDCCVYFFIFVVLFLCAPCHTLNWASCCVRQCFPLHRLVLPFSYCNCTRDVVNVLSDFHSSQFTWRTASFFSSNFFVRFAVCDAMARKQLLSWTTTTTTKNEMKE